MQAACASVQIGVWGACHRFLWGSQGKGRSTELDRTISMECPNMSMANAKHEDQTYVCMQLVDYQGIPEPKSRFWPARPNRMGRTECGIRTRILQSAPNQCIFGGRDDITVQVDLVDLIGSWVTRVNWVKEVAFSFVA
jgi:hypothetical protein